MLTNRKLSDRSETTRYVVTCRGCSFERTVDGRDTATRIGSDHHHETGHDVVAAEGSLSTAKS